MYPGRFRSETEATWDSVTDIMVGVLPDAVILTFDGITSYCSDHTSARCSQSERAEENCTPGLGSGSSEVKASTVDVSSQYVAHVAKHVHNGRNKMSVIIAVQVNARFSNAQAIQEASSQIVAKRACIMPDMKSRTRTQRNGEYILCP